MPLPEAFKKNAKPKEGEEEVREGESDKEKKTPPFAKKGKKKGKKEELDTEIEKGGQANEGVTKMNDPRKKGMPALDDENTDSGNKKMDKKGKDCGCDHKNDALTPQEYLAACEGGFQDQSRSYIRARLDAAYGTNGGTKSGRAGKKCGASYIPAKNTCNSSKSGGKDGKGKRFKGGSRDKLSIRRGIQVGGSIGTVVGGLTGAAAGALGAKAAGGKGFGVAGGAALGGLLLAGEGARAGTILGGGVQAARKTGRAFKRAGENSKAINSALKGMKQKKSENQVQFATRVGQTVQNNSTKVWSMNNEFKNQKQFKGKRDSVWADGFGKFDAETALSANAMNLATDNHKSPKRRRNAGSQPRNTIIANTVNT